MSGGSNQETSTSVQQELAPSRPDSPITDIALDVASRLNEGIISGDQQDAEMTSTDPATIHHPLTTRGSSSAQPSASQTADPAHPGANRGKSADTPIIIRNSLPVEFSNEDLENFRQYFSIPPVVEMRFPLEGDKVSEPMVYPLWNEGPLAPGWTTMYIESLSYGVCFPFFP
ncbi:hypothetical protein LIER_19682 [Lithospermum erythrorhizon]|uniref:Uncharacterized protein n=1 Tax=Lithospermum erythrorhizon TaxID=34254 RepID=A0AAV3QJR6_LITER